MKERLFFPPVYMFIVTTVYGGVLIGLGTWANPRIEANQQFAFERAVLASHGLDQGSTAQLHQRFQDRFKEVEQPGFGTVYVLQEDGQTTGYAVPFEGRGFWAPIRGVIGFEPDRQTVTGLGFYDQSETPGLGAEIVKPYFRNAFDGKVIQSNGRPLRLVPPGQSTADNEVHAITGATQTSTRLEDILNDAIRRWQAAQDAPEATP